VRCGAVAMVEEEEEEEEEEAGTIAGRLPREITMSDKTSSTFCHGRACQPQDSLERVSVAS
jgi:hypothetical protein